MPVLPVNQHLLDGGVCRVEQQSIGGQHSCPYSKSCNLRAPIQQLSFDPFIAHALRETLYRPLHPPHVETSEASADFHIRTVGLARDRSVINSLEWHRACVASIGRFVFRRSL